MHTQAAILRELGLPRAYAQSRPLVVQDIELAAPADGEILVRVGAAGLCHSDLSVIDGTRPRPMPMVLGHEAAGVVEACGAGSGFSPGDHVVFAFVPSCGACLPCAEGRPALCEPGAAANTAGTLLGGGRRWCEDAATPVNHHLGVSGFARHIVTSARSAVRVDAALPMEVAALFGCAVMTGVGAVVNTAQVRPGESCAIVGLGGVGLAALLGALAAGAHPVIGVDRVPQKLALARELGAAQAVLAGPEATGRNDDRRRAAASRSMLSIPAVSLVAEERTLKGSYLGGAIPRRDIPRYIALHRAGRLPVERLLSHRLRLEEVNPAFDRLADGEAVRQVILFE